MSSTRMTEAEAARLIQMLKRTMIQSVALPECGKSQEFDVVGDTPGDLFTVSMYCGKINANKHNIGARIRVNGTMLMELHINRTAVHKNPDGKKIIGNHWHIYSEKYGRNYAVVADDIQNDSFVDNTIELLKRFNVIKMPSITYQPQLM